MKASALAFIAFADAGSVSSRRRGGGEYNCGAICHERYGSQSSGYVKGTAPFCSGNCNDCHDGDICGPNYKVFNDDDGGHHCHTGSKQCCCTNPSEVEVRLDSSLGSNLTEVEEPQELTDADEVDGDDDEVAEPQELEEPRNVALKASSRRRAPECYQHCQSLGIKYAYVRGTAPFCAAGPGDCCAHDFPALASKKFSDGGDTCMSGKKECCCGTPAGQSNCPHAGFSLSCFIVKGVCDTIGAMHIDSTAGCAEMAVSAASICEAVGLGPEDPVADLCAAIVGGAIEDACKEVVQQGQKLSAAECKRAAGCATSADLSNTSSVVV